MLGLGRGGTLPDELAIATNRTLILTIIRGGLRIGVGNVDALNHNKRLTRSVG